MKKYIPLLAVFAFIPSFSHAGTNAALVIRTNDLVVLPTSVWASNAVAIAGALTAINFSPGTNTNTTRFNPAQFTTNSGTGQVQVQNLAVSVLVGPVAATNLPPTVATLSSNLDPGLTNALGLTTAAQIAAATNHIDGAYVTNTIADAVLPTNGLFSNQLSTPTVLTRTLLVTNSSVLSNSSGVSLTVYGQDLFNDVAHFNAFAAGATNSVVIDTGADIILHGGYISGDGSRLINVPLPTVSYTDITGTNTTTGLHVTGDASATNGFFSGAVTAQNFIGGGQDITGGNASTLFNSGTIPVAFLPSFLLTNQQPAATLPGLTLTNSTNAGQTQWTGDVAYLAYNNSSLSPAGEQADIATGTNVAVILSGPISAWAMDGLAGGRDGRYIIVEYDGGQTVTVRNESGIDSTPANRIRTGSGIDIVYSGSPLVLKFRYNGNLARWVLTSANGTTAAGSFTGSFVGNVTGTVTGNISGAVTLGVPAFSTNYTPSSIWLFGDSIMYGWHSSSPWLLIPNVGPPTAGMGQQVANAFFGGDNSTFYNLAVPGNTTFATSQQQLTISNNAYAANSLMIYGGSANDIFAFNPTYPFDTNVGPTVASNVMANLTYISFLASDRHPIASDLLTTNNPYGFTNGTSHWQHPPSSGDPFYPAYNMSLWGQNGSLLSTNPGDYLTLTNVRGPTAILSVDTTISNAPLGGIVAVLTNGALWGTVNCNTTNSTCLGGQSNAMIAFAITNLSPGINTLVISNASTNAPGTGGWIAVNYCLSPTSRGATNHVDYVDTPQQPGYIHGPAVTAYDAAMSNMCATMTAAGLKVNFIDISWFPTNYMATDGIHLNYEGHLIAAYLILAAECGSIFADSYLRSPTVIPPAMGPVTSNILSGYGGLVTMTNTAVNIITNAANQFAGNGSGLTGLPAGFTYPSGTTGFTNGSGGGLALTWNNYYTNNFGAPIFVTLTFTNTSGAGTFTNYPFRANGTARQPIPYGVGNGGTTPITPAIQFWLAAGEYFAATNGTGSFGIKTNEVDIW